MRALTFQAERTLRLESLRDPELRDAGDALVAVKLAGICGSDLHVWHGRERGLDRGTVMGHEFVGEVLEVGSAVRGLAPGDRVLSPFTTSCGRCWLCRHGLSSRCGAGRLFGWVENGEGLHGAQAERVRVPLAESTLVRVPEEVPDDVALLLGDVAATGYFCASMAGIRPAGAYAVVGCGPVGLMAVLGAVELGARTLFAVDAVPERLAHAERFGARPVDCSREDPVEIVRRATEGRGADAVMEAVGSPAATRAALDLVRPGGTIAAVGVHNEPAFPFSPAEAYERNLTYRIGRCPARSLIDDLLPLARAGKYDYASIISHRLPLSLGPAAYSMFDDKRDGCTKVVLDPAAG
jgi:threonine dehydrogenase-like Zn-dependent dehydrogenase